MKNVDIVDRRAYFRVLYLRAALCANLWFSEKIRGQELANNLFAANFTQNWFNFINLLITFDGKPARGDRWKSDKFVAMR